ncbi:MAG TPA: dihydropteroate synthase, partial [Gemmatimonadales bacterium]|nr:dihydropteroate synthase [Gemmatimonadales bacterium]
MNVVPLATHSPRALRETLRAHGWEAGPAEVAAGSTQQLRFHLTGLDESALEALVRYAGHLGLEVHTGAGWAVLAGTRWRLGSFARPWSAPEPLAEVALQVGLAIPPEEPSTWLTAQGPLQLDEPVLVGILNVTPDSFSDGGRYATPDSARAHADRLVAAGARVLDVGGESTRPGRSEPVPEDEELRRVVPVIRAIAADHPGLVLSVDTVKSAVARAAFDAGAAVVNDVTAFRFDPAMAEIAAAAKA